MRNSIDNIEIGICINRDFRNGFIDKPLLFIIDVSWQMIDMPENEQSALIAKIL